MKAIKNKTGEFVGVYISIKELSVLTEHLKETSEIRSPLEKFIKDWEETERKLNMKMPDGFIIKDSNHKNLKTTEDLYRKAFSKGLPMFYRDERTLDTIEFVRANPDGSEDLVVYNFEQRNYTFIKSLCSAGKGYWSYIINKKIE